MNCEDCIHYDVCEVFEIANGMTKIPPDLCACYDAKENHKKIVLCKYCKYYGFTKIAGESYMTCKSPFGMKDPASTDFCSSGERKEQT